MMHFLCDRTKALVSSLIMFFFWKCLRRRPIIYYATVVAIFGLLILAWTMILTQLSSANFGDESKFSVMVFSSHYDNIVTRKDIHSSSSPDASDDIVNVQSNDLTVNLLESYRSEIIRLQTEIEQLKKDQEHCSSHMSHISNQMELLKKGGSMSNEYEVYPFNHFTFTRIYPSSLALGKRVVEKPIGSKRKEIIDVLGESLKLLVQFNRSLDDFIEGIYSTDPLLGTQYHLYFKTSKKGPSGAKFYHKVTLLRPFSTPKIVSNEIISTQRETINLILPLSEDRLEQLSNFMDNIRRLTKFESGRLKLFLVYFGDLMTIKKYCCDDFNININRSSPNKTIPIKIIHVSNSSSDFSRAKGLHLGAASCCKNSSLLFFCDVDLLFTMKFLERCRLNASAGKKVYYPILFSLYNPKYSHVHVPNFAEDPSAASISNLISSQSGFWRDFGFGMTCQYKSDFMSVGGFSDYLISIDDALKGHNDEDNDINIVNLHPDINAKPQLLSSFRRFGGWGGEDVLLYRRHLQHPRLMVIRAVDPGLFHIWHEKHCDPKILLRDQYSSCLSSRALNEASHAQMAQQLMHMHLKMMTFEKSSN